VRAAQYAISGVGCLRRELRIRRAVHNALIGYVINAGIIPVGGLYVLKRRGVDGDYYGKQYHCR